jgi:spore germination protein YaaH
VKHHNTRLVYLLPIILIACSSTRQDFLPESEGTRDSLSDPTELPMMEDPVTEPLPVSPFHEIWAYLLDGREDALKEGMPVSDIGYFGAEINSYGQLVSVPNARKVPASFGGKDHLVVKCDSTSLTHFILVEGSRERRELVAALLAAVRNYDGLQIDFEYIPALDGPPFLSFLGELRDGLGSKVFSIALKARTRTLANDVYDYAKIEPLVDRILVMAYDEHWAGSRPGPIAGMDWCRNVAEYALSVIGREKLIMGLPFYGRAWSNPDPAKAYTFPGVEGLLNENEVGEIQREDGIPTFQYNVPVSVTVYYEDEVSLSQRLEMYRGIGVRGVGFWRLGQETAAVWDVLHLEAES